MRTEAGFVTLKGVRVHAFHGVMPQERVTGADFVVNVKVKYPLQNAVKSDDVRDTINYAKIFEIINKEMQKPSNLLEHVAGRIGESIVNQMPMTEEVFVTVEKVNPPMGADLDCAMVELHFINDKTF